MKRFFCILFVIGTNFLNAQKIVRKSIIAPTTSYIHIDANNCFQVFMETIDTDEITVEAIIDGEYRKDLVLKIGQEGATAEVSVGFQPNFIAPNDKLSAHKVISVALKIQLPKHKNVQVFGTSSNITATGNYTYLKIFLDDGNCTLDSVAMDAEVITQSGEIRLVNTNAEISAVSKYGKVYGATGPTSNPHFKLITVTGDIHLSKTE